MTRADFLVVGGGIAGLSAAASLVRHGKVIVLEAEDAPGYHSSGRSVSFSHYGIGNAAVRGMTAWSRPFFERQPEGFSDAPVSRPMQTLYMGDLDELPALQALYGEMSRFTDAVEWIDAERLRALCPAVRTGPGGAERAILDPTGIKLDADALLQGYARALKAGGGELLTRRRVEHVEPGWTVRTDTGERFTAPVLVNAAGAWADRVAAMAGVAPLGLQPKRRTIIVVDPPAGAHVEEWPFVHAIAGDFYMLPEAGQLLVSPADEVDDEPSDAAPEDYDVALAADRLERYTTLSVRRIAHRWAGLRSFVADRTPTAGFDDAAPGFFWLVGQGGYGLQTAPAMAAIVEALAAGGAWPEGLAALGVTAGTVDPERLRRGGSSQSRAT
ncbi:MAG: FAD-binding oxidoreductase [Alphaproteobacteria bacterium]|nr:FAD-binding oxidoreductase [Alphaproteobacteria bacterium]MBV9372904.1 FAD-binding oxidoreductase [Alphaproteobacteria bacterium]MBV9902092.1 FAD-binding oxidoreductase [Alphaproteobacteria bacterium]